MGESLLGATAAFAHLVLAHPAKGFALCRPLTAICNRDACGDKHVQALGAPKLEELTRDGELGAFLAVQPPVNEALVKYTTVLEKAK